MKWVILKIMSVLRGGVFFFTPLSGISQGFHQNHMAWKCLLKKIIKKKSRRGCHIIERHQELGQEGKCCKRCTLSARGDEHGAWNLLWVALHGEYAHPQCTATTRTGTARPLRAKHVCKCSSGPGPKCWKPWEDWRAVIDTSDLSGNCWQTRAFWNGEARFFQIS